VSLGEWAIASAIAAAGISFAFDQGYRMGGNHARRDLRAEYARLLHEWHQLASARRVLEDVARETVALARLTSR
jgi:hypothetical protein